MRKFAKLAAVFALAFVAGCDTSGGGGGAGLANASVSGSANGTSYDYTPGDVGAKFTTTQPTEGEASIHLCEAGCPPLGAQFTPGTRAVSLTVQGGTADLRSGGTFRIGREAFGVAQLAQQDGNVLSDEATSGEVVIESADIRNGGNIIGTFQMQMSSGTALSGFFEAPFVEVSGPVVVLGQSTLVDSR